MEEMEEIIILSRKCPAAFIFIFIF